MPPEKFKNKYRISSARLKNYDYSKNGYYFITICTKNRENYFGDFIQNEFVPTNIGIAAQKCWDEIPLHFPFVRLDTFIVMPNHVHGILVIDTVVETQNLASLQQPPPPREKPNQFGPQSRNLASIIRGYKIGVTKFSKKQNVSFAWQARYHDHIIRNEEELNRIRIYIINNRLKWLEDRYFI